MYDAALQAGPKASGAGRDARAAQVPQGGRGRQPAAAAGHAGHQGAAARPALRRCAARPSGGCLVPCRAPLLRACACTGPACASDRARDESRTTKQRRSERHTARRSGAPAAHRAGRLEEAAGARLAAAVTREMGRAEALLKVVGSRPENLADNFFTLLPAATPADFQRIVDLKARAPRAPARRPLAPPAAGRRATGRAAAGHAPAGAAGGAGRVQPAPGAARRGRRAAAGGGGGGGRRERARRGRGRAGGRADRRGAAGRGRHAGADGTLQARPRRAIVQAPSALAPSRAEARAAGAGLAATWARARAPRRRARRCARRWRGRWRSSRIWATWASRAARATPHSGRARSPQPARPRRSGRACRLGASCARL